MCLEINVLPVTMDPHQQKPARPSPPANFGLSQTSPIAEFEKTYHGAYKAIDQGVTLVSQGQNAQGQSILQKGLELIDIALSTKVESFEASPEKIQMYIEMQLKMRCTRKEILSHFVDSQSSVSSNSQPQTMQDAPPSYDDYLSSMKVSLPANGASNTMSSLNPHDPHVQATAFSEIGNSPLVTPVMSPQAGEMIFQIENGVQIFFIYPDGRVTSPSYPSFLAVFTFPELIPGNDTAGARGFLQVGEWSYPLVPAQSPVLHSFYGAYMFPDVTNSLPGTSVGVILPDSVEKDNRDLFESLLHQLTSYHEQEVPEGVDVAAERQQFEQSNAEWIASGLVSGAEMVSKGVVWGAERLGELITMGTDNLKGHIQPEPEKKQIDPKWHSTAATARNVSGKAVKVSGYLLSQVGKATMLLGRKVAPHIHKQGTRAISHFTGEKEKEASAKVDGVLEVAAGAVKGVSAVYMSLETAAGILATNVTDNTVKTVTHKYGEDAGKFSENAMYAVGQTAMVGHNVSSLGVKGVAKRAAKDTGKALVQDIRHNKQLKK